MEDISEIRNKALEDLNMWLSLLDRAKVRRIGYIKFSRTVKTDLWYSYPAQEKNSRDLESLNRGILRLENICRGKCQTVLINI